jgi:integrase
MSVYLPKGCTSYRYDFHFKGKRYLGSTEQSTKKAAQKWEDVYRDRLKREYAQAAIERASGIVAPPESPRFSDWAAVYRAHVEQLATQGRLARPDTVHDLLRVVLRFFGARPSGKNLKNLPVAGEPYHDLRLTDPIKTPQLIADFEEWMSARGVAGQTKNHYRSTVRQMYQLALQPNWRAKTGVMLNPLDGIYRDRGRERDVILSPDELREILRHASYHLRLALAIGALAPKLRLANILALEWKLHLDPQLHFITVHRHKTATKTRRPLVVPISQQLREILLDARQRTRGNRFVVSYRGEPIKSLRAGLIGAVNAAGLRYGLRHEDGVTFHTLRHTAATIMAELDVSESKRKAAMGHEHLATTQRYTHLRPVKEIPTIEALSEALPLVDLVKVPWRRASRKTARTSAGLSSEGANRSPASGAILETAKRGGEDA